MATGAVLETDVRSAMTGDRDAFQRVIEGSANAVCSIALAIVRNPAASEDVAQNAYLSAWTDLHKLRNPVSFLPWLRQITRNQAFLWMRNHAREISDDVAIDTARDTRTSPERTLLDREEQQIFAEVFDELPEETRETVILYYREEQSARHVADLLGISEEAVKQRLSRARTRMRESVRDRFAAAVRRTAPGVAFPAAVVMSLGTAAASIGGILGVFMSMLHLGSPFDEQEKRELRAFARTASAVMVLASIALALAGHADTHPPRLWTLLTLAISVSVLGWLYAIRLPRILDRRLAWEREVNAEIAAQRRWRHVYATIAQTAAAAVGALAIVSLLAAGHC